jgi:hypothetical protein
VYASTSSGASGDWVTSASGSIASAMGATSVSVSSSHK